MKTIQAIVNLASQAAPGTGLALATVVKVRGSAYRRPGARMLVTPQGETAGMISGGCLEEDVCAHAAAVMQSGQARLITYDSTAPEDIVFGLGLGCNGVVHVLIEPVTSGDPDGILTFLSACVERRQPGRIATVFECDSLPCPVRVLRWPDGRLTSTVPDAAVTAAMVRGMQENALRRTAIRKLTLPGECQAQALFEAVAPPAALTICGAGDDAIPLVQVAKLAGWHVTVIDARPLYATRERLPLADAVHCLRPEQFADTPGLVFPREAMVMIMTHSFTRDRELLRTLLPRPLRYVGVLGPKSRTERLLTELADEGLRFSDERLATLHGPAGLDIGAETPEEIAVSIFGEMQAVLAGRQGGALRDRDAPIHDPAEPPAFHPA